MAKNNNTWIFVGIGILILIVLSQTNILQKQEPQIASISATYYDANGNEIDFQPYSYELAMKQAPKTSIFQSFGIVPMATSYSFYPTVYNVYSKYGSGPSYAIVLNNLQVGSTSSTSGRNLLLKFNSLSVPHVSNINSVQSATITLCGYGGSGTCDTTLGIIPDYETYNWNDASTGWNRLSSMGGNFWGWSSSGGCHTFDLGTTDVKNELSEQDTLDIGITGEMATRDYTTFQIPQVSLTYTYDCNQEATCNSTMKQCGSWNICGQNFNCGTCSSPYSCNVTGQCEYAPTFAKYQVNVVNNGQIPYKDVSLIEFKITIPRTSFLGSFPSNKYNLSLGQSANWTSSNINISAYKGQTLTAFINALNTYTNQTQLFTSSMVI